MSELPDPEARLIKSSELQIQKMLLGLDEYLTSIGHQICGINVDTRLFANMAVDIQIMPTCKVEVNMEG